MYLTSPHIVFCIATAIQMRYAYRGNNIVYRTVYRNVYLKIYISLSSDIYRENQTLKTPENNMYSRCDISYRTVYRKCILDRMSVCISKYIAHAPSQLSSRSRTCTSNSYSPEKGGGRRGRRPFSVRASMVHTPACHPRAWRGRAPPPPPPPRGRQVCQTQHMHMNNREGKHMGVMEGG